MKFLYSNNIPVWSVSSAQCSRCGRNLWFGCRIKHEPNNLLHCKMALLLDTRLLLRKVKDLRCLTPRRNRVKEKWVRYQSDIRYELLLCVKIKYSNLNVKTFIFLTLLNVVIAKMLDSQKNE